MKFPRTIDKAALEAMYQAKVAEYDAIDITTPKGKLAALLRYNPLQNILEQLKSPIIADDCVYLINAVSLPLSWNGVPIDKSFHIAEIRNGATVTAISYNPETVTTFITSDKNDDPDFLITKYINLYNALIAIPNRDGCCRYLSLEKDEISDVHKRLRPKPLFSVTDNTFCQTHYRSGQNILPLLLNEGGHAFITRIATLKPQHTIHMMQAAHSLQVAESCDLMQWTPSGDITKLETNGAPMTMDAYIALYNTIAEVAGTME